MGWLEEVDKKLLLMVNGVDSPALDAFMVFVSEKWVWIPVYVLLLALIVWRMGWRNALWVFACAGTTVLIADQVSSSILKPLVGRLRPCHEPSLESIVREVAGKCGGQYGFVSSHAANFFGLAVVLGMSVFRGKFWAWVALLGVAALVAYSRVHLGVHYPSDVAGGAMVGILAGLGVVKLGEWLRRRFGRTIHNERG